MRLIELAKQLVSSEITAAYYELEYLAIWREEGKAGLLAQDPKTLGECASTLFILADCYNPDPDRHDSELDEEGLKQEVEATLRKFDFL